jgi:hypothetical protein
MLLSAIAGYIQIFTSRLTAERRKEKVLVWGGFLSYTQKIV